MKTAIDRAATAMNWENSGFFIAQYEPDNGKGIQTRYRGNINMLLGILASLTDTILTNAEEQKYDREDVLNSLCGTFEKTIELHGKD